jgi:hypothetical protein
MRDQIFECHFLDGNVIICFLLPGICEIIVCMIRTPDSSTEGHQFLSNTERIPHHKRIDIDTTGKNDIISDKN